MEQEYNRSYLFDNVATSSLWWNQIRILPCCSHVNATVWLHHMDSNEKLGEKACWELHKDVVYCFEQIMVAALDKAAVVRPLT